MIFALMDKIPAIRRAADEQIGYEKFLDHIKENIDQYKELTLVQLKEIIQKGCDDLNLSKDRTKMLFDYVVKQC